MERMTTTSESIERIRETPQLLIDCIPQATKITLPDISDGISEIERLVQEFFKESAVLDEHIKTSFVGFTASYLENFLLFMDSIAINKSIRDISGNIAVITFEKVFSGEEFKTFVLSSLKQSIEGIAPPEKETNILLILKSVLEQSIDSPYKIDVDSKIYSIVSTYLATFFPYIR